MIVTGDYVQTWWDTGAFGATPLVGRVIASGPMTFTVEWESGIKNRCRHGDARVKPITQDKYRELVSDSDRVRP